MQGKMIRNVPCLKSPFNFDILWSVIDVWYALTFDSNRCFRVAKKRFWFQGKLHSVYRRLNKESSHLCGSEMHLQIQSSNVPPSTIFLQWLIPKLMVCILNVIPSAATMHITVNSAVTLRNYTHQVTNKHRRCDGILQKVCKYLSKHKRFLHYQWLVDYTF